MHHKETLFTIGNGYLCTRGAFEEGYPEDRRATFIHGVFDAARLVHSELVNAPDWLPLTVHLNGERFSLCQGAVKHYRRTLDLRHGVVTRVVRWQSPSGLEATLTFERFASLADPHALLLRCRVLPEFAGTIEFRASLNGHTDNLGVSHCRWVSQDAVDGAVFLRSRARQSGIDMAYAMRLLSAGGRELSRDIWDVENVPSVMLRTEASPGRVVAVEKQVAVYTSRDLPADRLETAAVEHVHSLAGWDECLERNTAAWADEWERTDVVIEGDDEAQLALRFDVFQLLIAAPRTDDRVSIGAKTLSGFGYHGHAFWDTEIFMLPLFTFTAPSIARNLLNYRYHCLDEARRKARLNGHEGAQFAWESAATGEEATPAWIPHYTDRTKLVRIWTGDIELHISADVAYAAHQYWQVTGDDDWFADRGAELVLESAKFWASRAEWNGESNCYGYKDVIGPDEYHDHVDNNAYTNRMAQWNIETGLRVLEWLRDAAPARVEALKDRLDLTPERLARWRDVAAKMYMPLDPSGLVEQFEGYLGLNDVHLQALEPRTQSVQQLFGIQATSHLQAIKQPDVLMLLYLLRGHFPDELVRLNYEYYTPRTDLTYGSSLGPAIQAIMACEVGKIDEAYAHWMRAARADLCDARSNAGDGVHGASAGGAWQGVVFGFAGLHVTPEGWEVRPRLPRGWKRLAFRFLHRGVPQQVDISV